MLKKHSWFLKVALDLITRETRAETLVAATINLNPVLTLLLREGLACTNEHARNRCMSTRDLVMMPVSFTNDSSKQVHVKAELPGIGLLKRIGHETWWNLFVVTVNGQKRKVWYIKVILFCVR